MVGTHVRVDIPSPLVFKGDQAKAAGLGSSNDFFGSKQLGGFILIKGNGEIVELGGNSGHREKKV